MAALKIIIGYFAGGFGSIVDAYTNPRDYIRPSGQGFSQDQARLTNDIRNVGNDMRKAISRHGKQQHRSSRHAA